MHECRSRRYKRNKSSGSYDLMYIVFNSQISGPYIMSLKQIIACIVVYIGDKYRGHLCHSLHFILRALLLNAFHD